MKRCDRPLAQSEEYMPNTHGVPGSKPGWSTFWTLFSLFIYFLIFFLLFHNLKIFFLGDCWFPQRKLLNFLISFPSSFLSWKECVELWEMMSGCCWAQLRQMMLRHVDPSFRRVFAQMCMYGNGGEIKECLCERDGGREISARSLLFFWCLRTFQDDVSVSLSHLFFDASVCV